MTVEYEKRGDRYLIKKGDKQRWLPKVAIESIMTSLKIDEKAAVEYQAKHIWPESEPRARPTPPPIPPTPPSPPPVAPPKPTPKPEPKDDLDKMIDELEDEDEEEDLEDEEEEEDEEEDLEDEEEEEDEEEDLEDEDEEEDEEEEEDEGLTEEERAELIKEVKKGIEDEKTWNDYKWLIDMAGRLEYFEGPGTPKKDKASLQKWLKKQKS